MTKVESPPIMPGEGRPAAKANPSHSKWTGALMAAGGLLLMLGDTAFLWLSREELTGIGPQAFKRFGTALAVWHCCISLEGFLLAQFSWQRVERAFSQLQCARDACCGRFS